MLAMTTASIRANVRAADPSDDRQSLAEIFWRAPLDSLHDASVVAAALDVSVTVLGLNRLRRTGIPYINIGRLVRYRKSDVLTYLDENRHEPENK